jgi:hypothetical protein
VYLLKNKAKKQIKVVEKKKYPVLPRDKRPVPSKSSLADEQEAVQAMRPGGQGPLSNQNIQEFMDSDKNKKK